MLRKAEINDTKTIYNIFSETLTPWSEENIKSSIQKDFVLLLGEKGVIVMSKVLDECEVLNFAVCKDERGKGYGKTLLTAALDSDFAKNTSVFLEVRKSNIAAISLYEKVGFCKMGERKRYYTNPLEDAVLMRMDNF